MGKRKYPPLKHREVVDIVLSLGFVLDRQESSHAQYELAATATRNRAVVTVDNYDDFEEKTIKRIIAQSGFTRQQFYGATPKTAKKIR
ncbi:MAG: type II toxin-antitoxin system HicA family toxin [Candidatus Sulfotelmatobacter sp.]